MTVRIGSLGNDYRFSKDLHLGHALLFVKPHVEEMDTQFGLQEAAVCEHVICCTCRSGWRDVAIFGSYLVPRLATGDDIVGGVLTQGQAQAGKNPPWLLDDLPGDDREIAQELADQVITRLGSGKLAVDLDLLAGPGEDPL
jgi:hypothetical protein